MIVHLHAPNELEVQTWLAGLLPWTPTYLAVGRLQFRRDAVLLLRQGRIGELLPLLRQGGLLLGLALPLFELLLLPPDDGLLRFRIGAGPPSLDVDDGLLPRRLLALADGD